MKKILLLLMVMSMSACAVTDKPETNDYDQLWKDRVINKTAGISSFDRNANLTYLTETYTFVLSKNVGKAIYKKYNLYYGVLASENFTTTLKMTSNGFSDSSDINWFDVKNITISTPDPEPDYNQLWKDRVINKTAGVSSFDNNADLSYLTETYIFDSSLEVGRGIYKKDNLYYGVLADEIFTTTLSMTKTGVTDSTTINWADVKNITTSTPEPEPDYNQLWKDRVASKIAGVSRFDNNADLTYEGVYNFDSSSKIGRGIYKKDNLYYGVLADEIFTTTLSMTKTGVTDSTTINWADVKNITTATPDPDAGKKRFIANLRNLGNLYTGGSDVNIGENGAVSYIYTASVTPITYTYYLKEVLNDTQAIYTLKSIATGGYDYFIHQVFSIEDNAIWSYNPTNTTYSLALVKLGGINSGNQDRYNELATLAYDSKHIVPNDPKTSYRTFYKRDNSSLTDNNTLNLNSRYYINDVLLDYTISGSTINWDRYITNNITVTVSSDKNTITYTKPQPASASSIDRVLTFYKMQGSEAIYKVPITPNSPLKAYYAITIRNNVLYMGFKYKSNPITGDLELDLKQRGLGTYLY